MERRTISCVEPCSVPRGAYNLAQNQYGAGGNFLHAAITVWVVYKNHAEKHASASAVVTSVGSRAKLPGFEFWLFNL